MNMTFSFSAAGTALDIVVCVAGLSDAELPGTDFLVLEVPGLRVGGGANASDKGLGYVLFRESRNEQNTKKVQVISKEGFYPGLG